MNDAVETLGVAISAANAYHGSQTSDEYNRKIDVFFNMINELVFIPSVGKPTDGDVVALTDDFINDVVDNIDNARERLYAIAKQIWITGSPKILFTDRTDEDNMVKYLDNPCVDGDTLIQTVSEGARPIKELADEGYDVLIYTWNSETKLPEVGIMRDIRKTREHAKVVKVIFDSDLEVICTPDHNFYAIRGKQVEAQNLRVGQSVRAYKGEVHRDGHVRVHGWAGGKVKHQYTARMVYEFFNGEIAEGNIIHHRNMLENDNNPENLESVTVSLHNSIHYANRHRSGFGNHKVVAVKEMLTTADVYNGVVDGTHAYIIADPDSTKDFFTGIVSANCGETPSLSGSINLHKMYDTKAKDVNWEFLEYIVRNAVIFLDCVQEIGEESKGVRHIGLGVMGWADLLAELDIPYSSEDALDLAKHISWFITYFAYLQSMTLAAERGTFDLYDSEKVDLRTVNRILNCPEFAPRALDIEEVRQLGLRNVAVTNIASISSVADVSPGIEPLQEATPDWHIRMQAAWQLYTDNVVSKIIRLPNETKVVDVYEAIVAMWVANLKSGTIYRTNSKVF